MFREIPAVRRAVPLTGCTSGFRALREVRPFSGMNVVFHASGKEALAAAILSAVERHPSREEPLEVILPAYGCPDLIAACVYSNVLPRLVDVSSEGWGYDLEGLRRALSPTTAAIVAVNLMG